MRWNLLFIVALLGAIFPAVVSAESRPNFLLIIADDSTWSDYGFTGNQQVHTPHLDGLRTESMYLSQMYSPATTCSPSRNALYSGLYCIRSGAFPNHTRLYDGTKSLFTHLKEQGYRVGLQNKSHVGPRKSYPYEQVGSGADDVAGTREFIARNVKEPWFLAFASNDPHGPWTRGPKQRYQPAELAVPPYLHDNPTTREQLAAYYAEITKLDNQVGVLLELLEETGQVDDTLVMFVSEQGSSFPYGGKWSLYDTGIRVATLVRWPGRVAPNSSSDALVQYVDVAPTFLEAAGVDPLAITVGCPDADGHDGFDGRSFLGILTGQTNLHRDVVFSQQTTVGIHGFKQPYPMRAARDARYKLIRNLAPENTYFIGGIHKGEPISSWREDAKSDPELARRVEWLSHRPGVELYDLETDPLEQHNLADRPELAEVQGRLQRQLDEWMRQQGDRGLETELLAPTRQGKGGDGAQ
ncbi:MAG: sulfatase [Planctomycetaceae bacterium]